MRKSAEGEGRSKVGYLDVWRVDGGKVKERMEVKGTSAVGWAGQYAAGRSH